MVKLGAEIREEFCLAPTGAFLNNGSFGATPKVVINHRKRLQERIESQPDLHRYEIHPRLVTENLHQVGQFVGADPNNLVFVQNTTAGINAVLKSLLLKPGDGIMTYTCTYDSCQNICQALAKTKGITVHTLEFQLPVLASKHVVEAYDNYLREHPEVKVVLLDLISSFPTVFMPLQELISICRAHGKVIVVDGAQALGQVDVNVEELGVDFFAGDLHKWLFVPRASAILWVSPRYHSVVYPAVTSKSWDSPRLQERFEYLGAADYTPQYCVGAALEFFNSIGGLPAISQYCRGLMDEAVEYLTSLWGTSVFPIPPEMETPFMRLIYIPHLDRFIPDDLPNGSKPAFCLLSSLREVLWERFKVQTISMYISGLIWIRVSCHVYNTIEDYYRLGEAIKTLEEEENSLKTAKL